MYRMPINNLITFELRIFKQGSSNNLNLDFHFPFENLTKLLLST